jgi:hypothetical protein
MAAGADGEPPFEIPYRSCAGIIERLEVQRGLPTLPRVRPEEIPEALDAIAARGVGILQARMEKLDRRARAGRMTSDQARELAHLVRLSKQARAYWDEPRRSGEPVPPAHRKQGKSKSVVGGLVSEPRLRLSKRERVSQSQA